MPRAVNVAHRMSPHELAHEEASQSRIVEEIAIMKARSLHLQTLCGAQHPKLTVCEFHSKA